MCQSTCNNQVDDNGDGLVDDQDPKCIDPLTKTYNPSFSELF